MNSTKRKIHWGSEIFRFVTFFAASCFMLTCCMVLFLHNLDVSNIIDKNRAALESAAKLTALNVVIIAALFTLGDFVWRQFSVGRPVSRICAAAEKLMQGDLTARVEKERFAAPDEGYNLVIEYFNRMAEELGNVETLRTDFIANVSHELKTPLAVMQNYGTLLQQPQLSEEKRLEYAKTIVDSSRRLSNMMTNILKLNKLENQKIHPATATFDLGEQLCECFLAYENVWERKGIEIDTDIADGVLVTADPELLCLVWNNLFSNAFKFTEQGGKVSLALTAQDGRAAVSVADTGCGISPEVGKHIFEKFYQGDTSHATKGNGLGLALVKRVIDITGGEIAVQSEPGRGSTFTVTLGCAPDAAG